MAENNEEPEASEEEAPLPQLESRDDIANIVQALVFASPEIVHLKRIREVLGDFVDARLVADALQLANEKLASIDSPFELVEQAGGYRFRTRARFYPWVRRLFPENASRRLSQAALETLSVVAYRQPITKAEIEAVRGVSSEGPLKSLLEKKLIALGGRSDGPGNAYYYVTTEDFLKYFGINRIPEDLPRLAELDDLVVADALVPQYRAGKRVEETQVPTSTDPSQVELPMG